MFRTIVVFFTIFSLACCRQSQTALPIIELDNPKGSIDLKLSDILDDITFVPLETLDEILLSIQGSSSTITNNYILVRTNERLLQFDRKGRFIRTLAYKGNGPGEFNTIMDILVDERTDVVYYSDIKDASSIYRINLITGQFLEPIQPGLSSFAIKHINQDGVILGYTTSNLIKIDGNNEKANDSLALVFHYNPSDGKINTIKGNHVFTHLPFFGQDMVPHGEKAIYFNIAYSDTLYRVDRERLNPIYVLRLNNPLMDISKGGDIAQFFSYSGGLLISKYEMKIVTSGNTAYIGASVSNQLHLDHQHQLKSINSITIDPLAHYVDMKRSAEAGALISDINIPPMPRISGSWGYIGADAPEMVIAIQRALESDQLAPSYREMLEEVLTQIDDDSNPVLIIGKVK